MAIIQRTFQKLRELNLFRNPKKINETDEQVIRNQILSTRVYLVLLIISLPIFVLFMSLAQKPASVTIPSPSITTYNYLQSVYPDTISCPCQNVTISFSEFMSITPIYHQVGAF